MSWIRPAFLFVPDLLQVALAKDAADDAATALRLEPDNDYAHRE